MHKHFSARVVAAAVIFLIAFLAVSCAHATDSLPWITSAISINKQADTIFPPTTLGGSGNIDCQMEDASNCSVPTAYGTATNISSTKLITSGSFSPVVTYIDNRQHFFPIPNSDKFISYFNSPPYGLDLAFNYDFTSSAKLSGGSILINKPPDGKLTDKAKHLLAADIASASFSENSRWMVVSSPNLAVIRVNLSTFEVLPFAAGLNYTIGLDPGVKTAITNDGRYAVVVSKNFNVFKIYDLSTCSAVPDTITSAVNCQSRDLNALMIQSDPTYNSVLEARFLNLSNLSVYAAHKSGNVNKIARYVISNGPVAQIDYLGLGDSYISGEGAFDYMAGTDTDTNKCHLSFLSYPFLIGRDLNYNSYHSVACSGAVADDITNTSDTYAGQANSRQVNRAQLDAASLSSFYLDSFIPGYIDQLEFVKTYQPKAITMSIGGNDMGFSDTLKTCVAPSVSNGTCYNTYEDRLELIRLINNTVYPRLVQTYQKIKNAGPPNMRVYVIGYPQIAKPDGDCGLNVHLNNDEIIFSQELISYLDSVIQIAAAKAGVYYVDTQDALYDHRLCEAQPGSLAMNGLTAGNDRPTQLKGPLGDESYHPNDFGYMLLENKILNVTHNLTNPMPAANLSVTLPAESGLEILNDTHSGRSINATEFDPTVSADIAYQQEAMNINITGPSHDLGPGTTLKAELHSTPTSLGNLVTDSDGDINAQVTIPRTVPTGYHSLHFYGTDLSGQSIDIYKNIYVAANQDDIDGNGIADINQACVGIAPSGQDFDKDGIDDSCDGNITELPTALMISSNGSNNNSSQNNNPNNTLVINKTVTDPESGGAKVLAIQTSTVALDPGLDTGDILTSAANNSIGLSAQSAIASSQSDSDNQPNIIPRFALLSIGSAIMLLSIIGIAICKF